ncbi:DNA replication factor C, large subunit [Patellaria atrata CBS 101060]|uniref:Replication factor C subunit 1 n=1 Tax=Patellaria atrata CBS 101060 TaxID=1346257 RepID=A0A9P4VTG6_9PEZI|nr:DNA replication factor C, large subunit [Patellaria atrata CBS 101060]
MPADIRSFFGGKPAQEKTPAKKVEASPPKKRGKKKIIESSEDEEEVVPKKTTPKKVPAKKPLKRETTPQGEVTTTSAFFSSKNKPKRSEPVKPAQKITNESTSKSTPKRNTKGNGKKAGETLASKSTPNGRQSTRKKPTTSYKESDLDEDDFGSDIDVGDDIFTTTNSKTDAKGNGQKVDENPASTSTSNGRSSTRKANTTSYKKIELDEDDFGSDIDAGDDVFTTSFKKGARKDDYVYDSDVEEPKRLPVRTTPRDKQTRITKDADDYLPKEDVDMQDTAPDDDFLVPDGDERILIDRLRKGRKRKSVDLDEDEEDVKPKKTRTPKDASPKKLAPKGTPTKKSTPKNTPTKKTGVKRSKKGDEPENSAIQDILDTIPTVEAPAPPGGSKSIYIPGREPPRREPTEGATFENPVGADNCLAGLTFVFTGQLKTLAREEGQRLVKEYGGKVTGAPSRKTSYVVLGDDAGPKKLEVIKQHGLKAIDENGLKALIERLPANGGDGKAAVKMAEKRQAEEDAIRKDAEEMDRRDRERERQAAKRAAAKQPDKKSSGASSTQKLSAPTVDNRLWTSKYAPTDIAHICGNKIQVERLQRWLRNFPESQRHNFKVGGLDGSGVYRAVMLSGPPGVGKTTSAHLVAKLEGYDVVENNASDTRSKKLVEEGLKGVLSTTSLLGYFAPDDAKIESSKKKLVLIMDEVDGMSAGDRGGVGAMAAICKKTQIPIIMICNDRKLPKMKPFDYNVFDLPFRRPTVEQIRARMMTIAYREKLKIPVNVMNALIEGTNSDIRQVVNMISTAKLDEHQIDFEKGKEMSKAWEKHIVLRPWDIAGKILGGGMFTGSSKATLNEKSELYFNDHEFSYLMLQENYLSTKPIRANGYSGREQKLKLLELSDKAASSISDGDLVDSMIHGSQQQWSLMPVHSIFSFVRPASFISGSMTGGPTPFTQWLGKNSSQGKFTRLVKEIQGHMRLRASGDRYEVRQQYIPLLWTQLVKKLELEGKEAVPEVIELMDSYFLTKDDFDAIMELGVGPMNQEGVKIDSQAKATFTRLYNQQTHPLPFMKASNVAAPKGKVAKEKPDLEEAIGESDEADVIDDVKEEEEEEEDVDISKDKYIKAPKKKKAAPQKSANGKKRARDDDDEDSEESVRPKKGRGGAANKGKGKAKK